MKVRIILVFVLLAVVSLSAQTFRGTILGTVTGPFSAQLSPEAKVTSKERGYVDWSHHRHQRRRSYRLPELPSEPTR